MGWMNITKRIAAAGVKRLVAEVDADGGTLVVKQPAVRYAIGRGLKLRGMNQTSFLRLDSAGIVILHEGIGELTLRPSELCFGREESTFSYDLTITDDHRMTAHIGDVVGGICAAVLGGLVMICTGGAAGGDIVGVGASEAGRGAHALLTMEDPAGVGIGLVYRMPPVQDLVGNDALFAKLGLGPTARFPFRTGRGRLDVDYKLVGADRMQAVQQALATEFRGLLTDDSAAAQ